MFLGYKVMNSFYNQVYMKLVYMKREIFNFKSLFNNLSQYLSFIFFLQLFLYHYKVKSFWLFSIFKFLERVEISSPFIHIQAIQFLPNWKVNEKKNLLRRICVFFIYYLYITFNNFIYLYLCCYYQQWYYYLLYQILKIFMIFQVKNFVHQHITNILIYSHNQVYTHLWLIVITLFLFYFRYLNLLRMIH